MEIMAYSLLWVMQDLYNQPYFARLLYLESDASGRKVSDKAWFAAGKLTLSGR